MTVSATASTTHAARLPLPDRLAGAVWGHLVGDAVGVPYELRPAGEIGKVGFGAKGTHHQPPGTWSDDGALMLALLDSLVSCGFDTADQGRRAVEWFRNGAYTPDGTVFDWGKATAEAIRALESGTAAQEAGPTHERASGNGSFMRILPIVMVRHGKELDALGRRPIGRIGGQAGEDCRLLLSGRRCKQGQQIRPRIRSSIPAAGRG